MKKALIVFSLALAAGLAACAMPNTVVKSQTDRPGIAVQGAPQGATLVLDGVSMGETEKFDGEPGFLPVEPGTHTVAVKDASSNVVFERKVFVEGSLKVLKVN
jgi:hypothetical protein